MHRYVLDKSTTRKRGGLFKRRKQHGRSFEFPVPPQPWRAQHAIAPAMPQQMPSGALSPGETRWRTPSKDADVDPPWELATRLGALATVATVSVGLIIQFDSLWFGAPLPFCAIGIGVFLYSGRNLLLQHKDRYITQNRAQDAVWRTGAGKYAVEGKLDVPQGIHYLKLELSSRDAAVAWHRFCKAVANGKNFSQTQAVKRCKLPPADWGTIFAEFVERGWLQPAGERGTHQLLARGKAMVSMFAHTPPPA